MDYYTNVADDSALYYCAWNMKYKPPDCHFIAEEGIYYDKDECKHFARFFKPSKQTNRNINKLKYNRSISN